MRRTQITFARLLTLTVLSLWMAAAVAVDGVIEISKPMIISESGSYRLTQDIVHSGGIAAIRIEVSDVSLDLNGFTLSYTGSSNADGVSVTPTARNVEIKNGAITGFSRYGIFFPAGPSPQTDAEAILSKLRITQNGAAGISIEVRQGALISDCVVANNGSWGIRMATGLLLNSTVINNTNFGLWGAASTGYGSNVFSGNNGGAAQVSLLPKQIGTNICGTSTVCP